MIYTISHIISLLSSVLLFAYTAYTYNQIQTSRIIVRERLQILEMILFFSMIYMILSVMFISYEDPSMILQLEPVIFVVMIVIISYMVKFIKKLSYKDNKKYTKIEKILWQILDISKASRIGLVEYHMQFASLTQLVAHNKQYYDIMGQWVNMPMSAIAKWRADKEWLEVHDSSTYPDREIGKIAQSYNHVSIHHTSIRDIDDYSYGYVSMMYCENLYTIPQDDKIKIDELCKDIAEIIKADKLSNNIARILSDLQR